MKTPICLLLLLLGFMTQAQTYSELIKKGDELYDAKDYEASAKSYDQAFKLKDAKPRASHLYNAACSWALAGNKKKGLKRLEESIEKGWYDLSWMQQDSDLNSLHEEKKWATLVEKLDTQIKAEQATWNMALREELQQIHKDDQDLRRTIRDIEKEHGWKSPEMKALWKQINELDSINLIKIKKIIAEHGYPGKTLVGRDVAGTAFLVIQHSNLETQEEYLPILREAADKKELRWSSLALLIDRINTGKDLPQIYGSQVRRGENGEYEFFPIEDMKNVNKRRAEVGLGTLQEYGSHWNIEVVIPKE